METASKRKSVFAWLLALLIVTGVFGETRAWGFFAQPQPAPGVFEAPTQASTGQNYDASQYDAPGYAVAPKTTTLELNAATTWGRAETLADHFAQHGADFAAKTPDDYANMASRFFQESQAAKLPTKIDSQGVIRVFDPKTGTFGSFNPNGTTRTFFKPSSPTYFDRQPGTLVP